MIPAATLAALLLLSVVLTAQASGVQINEIPTPTPGPDGRIIYTVKEGETCTIISLLTGVPLDQLRALNNLDENCTLHIGDKLLIGIGGPAGNTPNAPDSGPTATALPPTATPIPGAADVCVLLFEDQNGDALRQDAEPAIEGGAVSITGTSGQYSQTSTTVAGTDPICFTKVPVGTYNISVAALSGYNPTTLLNYTLEIKDGDVSPQDVQPGDRVYVDFGAQKSSQAPATGDSPNAGNNNPWLGIVGGFLLLAGVGLAVYAWRVYGRRPKYMPPRPPTS